MLKTAIKFQILLYFICSVFPIDSSRLIGKVFSQEPEKQHRSSGEIHIYKLKPADKNGRGYKLVYMVDVPMEVFWRFKTDFENDFLLSNKYIKFHRFVYRQKNLIITEDEYSYQEGARFRWETTVLPEDHRLIFKLLNPFECNQRYHYGYIQLENLGSKTRVTQVAYFDFFGVTFWTNYPFYGGMYDFLKYSARWEQETVLKLKDRYNYKTGEKLKNIED